MPSPVLLVTGAGGQFGQRVLHHLIETLRVPPGRIIAATRKAEALAEWRAKGVTARAADFDDPVSLAPAFAGAQRLLLISTNTIDRPGHRLTQHKAAIEAAARANVQHVVYTSMPRPEGSPLLFAPDHAGTEAALASSALPEWTVLRNNWYFENLLMSLPNVLGSGKWFSAAGDGRVAYIARDDLARAAAATLAGATTGRTSSTKATYTLSGTKAYTTAEVAALASRTAGKPIQVVPVTAEELIRGLVGHSLPEPIARLVASIDRHIAIGGLADVTDDYKAITGAEPLPFEQWLTAQKL